MPVHVAGDSAMTTEGENVLVLADGDGNYYTITPELLQLAKVGTEEHRAKIRELTSGQDTSGYLNLGATSLVYAGSFQSSLNPYIRAGYYSPSIGALRERAIPPS
jgi:hypothetical protein